MPARSSESAPRNAKKVMLHLHREFRSGSLANAARGPPRAVVCGRACCIRHVEGGFMLFGSSDPMRRTWLGAGKRPAACFPGSAAVFRRPERVWHVLSQSGNLFPASALCQLHNASKRGPHSPQTRSIRKDSSRRKPRVSVQWWQSGTAFSGRW